jgi:1,4-alpha-glucan branching enzyme
MRRAACIGILLACSIVACTPPARGPRTPERGPDGVVFRFRAPSARVVQVSGSWDENFGLRGRDWSRFTRVGRMQDDDGDGVWETTVRLGPGRYEYSFLVDGRFWEVDPDNPERAPDGRGGVVSLLVVP